MRRETIGHGERGKYNLTPKYSCPCLFIDQPVILQINLLINITSIVIDIVY